MNAMNNRASTRTDRWRAFTALLMAAAMLAGCGGGAARKSNKEFFTSGNREADQRASQRMAKAEQLADSGEGAGENGAQTETVAGRKSGGDTNAGVRVEGKLSLFERLGSEAGISNIVEDFTPRVLDDPRVNWKRQTVKRSGISFRSAPSVAWTPSQGNVSLLKQHMVEFLSLATGGPPRYTGKDIQATHADMGISNPEFDAVMGDLKASLDKLKIPNREQKEVLAIVESTRPQIVTKR